MQKESCKVYKYVDIKWQILSKIKAHLGLEVVWRLNACLACTGIQFQYYMLWDHPCESPRKKLKERKGSKNIKTYGKQQKQCYIKWCLYKSRKSFKHPPFYEIRIKEHLKAAEERKEITVMMHKIQIRKWWNQHKKAHFLHIYAT